MKLLGSYVLGYYKSVFVDIQKFDAQLQDGIYVIIKLLDPYSQVLMYYELGVLKKLQKCMWAIGRV